MQTPEPVPPFKWYVFVDFENVPEVDLGRLEGKPARVTLLIGKNQKKLDLALVRQIHRLAHQVELVEVGASGHNALDLTLAYHLGREVERHPEAQFGVVSKDKDFDPLVAHVRDGKVEVARYAEFRLVPCLQPAPGITRPKPPATLASQVANRRAQLIAKLRDPATSNRPVKEKTLRSFIKATLGAEASEPAVDEAMQELIKSQALTIDEKGRVTYCVG